MLVYHDRIAVEFFHAITDGTGGTIFLKTLLAEYLCQKYGITVPAEDGVLGRLEEPDEEELEDSFLRYAGRCEGQPQGGHRLSALSGTPEPDGFKNLVTLMVPIGCPALLCQGARRHGDGAAGRRHDAGHLTACRRRRTPRRQPPQAGEGADPRESAEVVSQLAPCGTFASYITPEIDPRIGDLHLPARSAPLVHHRMGLENNPHTMQAKFAANVASERSPVLRVMPLFVKNLAMKLVFDAVGEREVLPVPVQSGPRPRCRRPWPPMCARMDFIIGVQAAGAPRLRRGVVGRTPPYINLHPQHPGAGAGAALLSACCTELGLPVKAESNQR